MAAELERGEWTGISTLEAIEEYRLGVAGEGPHASTWADKPHRLVYDLVRIAKTLTRERDEARQMMFDVLLEVRSWIHPDGNPACLADRVDRLIAALEAKG